MTADELRNTLRLLSLSLRARGCAPGTIEHYTIAVTQYHGWWTQGRDGSFVHDTTREHLREYLTSLFDRGLAPATVRARHNALNILFKELVEDGELDINPMDGVRPPKLPESRKDVVSPEDMARVLKGLDGEKAHRNAAIISLFYDTGMRASEMCRVRVDDVELDEMTIVLPKTKNREVRYVPYSLPTARRVERWLRHRPDKDSEWLFTGSRRYVGQPMTRSGMLQVVKETFTRYGIPGIGPHDLRHTMATHYLDDPEAREGDLQAIAGWNSPAMLRRYTRQGISRRAIAAHRRLSPVARLST